MFITVAKMGNKVVEIVRTADKVGFSEQRGWVCVCFDFDQSNRRKQQFKWVPATTQFDWVREFNV